MKSAVIRVPYPLSAKRFMKSYSPDSPTGLIVFFRLLQHSIGSLLLLYATSLFTFRHATSFLLTSIQFSYPRWSSSSQINPSVHHVRCWCLRLRHTSISTNELLSSITPAELTFGALKQEVTCIPSQKQFQNTPYNHAVRFFSSEFCYAYLCIVYCFEDFDRATPLIQRSTYPNIPSDFRYSRFFFNIHVQIWFCFAHVPLKSRNIQYYILVVL